MSVFDVITIPFCRFMGVSRPAGEGRALSLPVSASHANHLGTVHAGVLMSLAEACSGDYLAATYADLGFDTIPVVRRFEAKFRRPARGELVARPAQRNVLDEAFVALLRDKGRASIEVAVEVFDESGAMVLSATAEWFVSRVEQGTRD